MGTCNNSITRKAKVGATSEMAGATERKFWPSGVGLASLLANLAPSGDEHSPFNGQPVQDEKIEAVRQQAENVVGNRLAYLAAIGQLLSVADPREVGEDTLSTLGFFIKDLADEAILFGHVQVNCAFELSPQGRKINARLREAGVKW